MVPLCLRKSIKCSLLEAWRVFWGEALHACPVLTSPSEIHCWQLSKQRSWARWTFGPNPHCCSCVLIFYRTPFQLLGPPPSAPALPVHLCSVWASLCGKPAVKYILHHPLLTWSSAIHSLRRHHTAPWDPLFQISSTRSPQRVLLTSIWCPWSFGLHIFLGVPFLSLVTLNLRVLRWWDSNHCNLVMYARCLCLFFNAVLLT